MKAARTPRERPHRTPGPRGRVSQQRRRSPEPDCPHRSSPPGTRETASSARDRPPQRSASSDPSANRGGIIQRESNNSVRFHTWGNSGIEPYSGSGNQLSRNTRPASWGLQSWRTAMEHYVGLDVSLKLTAICIVDQTGKIEREGMVASNPEAI